MNAAPTENPAIDTQVVERLVVQIGKGRELEPLDVIIALTARLALAIAQLRAVALGCGKCGGLGYTRERFEIHSMTGRIRGPKLSARVCGSAVRETPCPACAEIRATIRTCEGPPE